MLVQDFQDGKLIGLSPSQFSRRRILYYFYALNFLGFEIGIIALMRLGDLAEHPVASIFFLLMMAVGVIGIIRCLNKATETEELFINSNKLDIILSSLTRKKTTSFEVAGIADLRFGKRDTYIDHPLKGNSFDYLGFQTEQQVIKNLHQDGLVSFLYNGREIKFGKDLASWDFDEISEVIHSQTGMDLAGKYKSEQEDFLTEMDQ